MKKFSKLLLLCALVIILIAGLQNPSKLFGINTVYGQQPFIYNFPIFLNINPTFASTSYYVTTLNSEYFYNLGCQLGTHDKTVSGTQNSVAVLAFGFPRCFDAGGYGANLFGFGPASISNVSSAVKQFALGYYTCTGSDNTSNLVIGAGTSNYLGGVEPCDTLSKAKAHGAAWSAMVRDINQWAVNQGIFHQVQVYGANDIEVGWNTPVWTRAWIAGFEQVSGNFMLHFGDAAGCPYEDNPQWSCGGDWTQEDVWFVSYGAPSALPLPLIYLTNGVHAKQWAYLSQYSVLQHGYRMDFTGVFTQWAYCQQFGWCSSTDNTPEMALQQLSYELSKMPATTQSIPWKTDIRWIMQNEIPDAASDSPGDEAQHHPALDWVESLGIALEKPAISQSLQASLASKQNTFQTIADLAALSQNDPAPKDGLSAFSPTQSQKVDFLTGIIEHGEMPGLPYGAEIHQVWQSSSDAGYLQIGTGTTSDGTAQGALYVLLTSPDRTSFQSAYIKAPEGHGPLSILGEGEGFLNLQSNDGSRFTFDLEKWILSPMPN